MAKVVFFRKVCAGKSKTGKQLYIPHPTDMAAMINSIPFQFDHSQTIQLVVDGKIHNVMAYRKADEWFVLENNYIRLQLRYKVPA